MITIHAIDSYGINPGDLPWERFHELGQFFASPYYSEEVLHGPAAHAEALLVDQVCFDAQRFSELPRLRYLGLFSTGHDHVDLEAARKNRVAVTYVPAYSTSSVAQMTIALLLSLASRVGEYDQYVHDGGWRKNSPFVYLEAPLVELADKNLGVLGFGSIGTAVAVRAHALGMRILGLESRRKRDVSIPVEWVSWERFLSRSDAITLHLPLTETTRAVIDSAALAAMRSGAFLINTARGGLVDDHALARALRDGIIGGAALDVVGDPEPPAADNPLLSAPNCVITPHIAWATPASRRRCLDEAALNLESYLSGKQRNRLV